MNFSPGELHTNKKNTALKDCLRNVKIFKMLLVTKYTHLVALLLFLCYLITIQLFLKNCGKLTVVYLYFLYMAEYIPSSLVRQSHVTGSGWLAMSSSDVL